MEKIGIGKIVLEKIKKNEKEITKSQKLVADYLVNHTHKVTYMTANQIGIEVGVSETTVIRFAMALGYKKFSELQEDFREKISKDRTLLRLQEASNEVGEQCTTVKSFQKDISNIQKTLEQIDQDELNQAIELICNAKNIYTIGFRSSGADAHYLGSSLNVMLNNVQLITNTGMELESCLQKADEDSVIIAFSYPRYTNFTIETAHYLKEEKNCKVIAITDSINSPIIPYCNHVFLCLIDSLTPTDSHVAGLALSNAIISAVGQQEHQRVKDNLNNLESYINKVNVFYGN